MAKARKKTELEKRLNALNTINPDEGLTTLEQIKAVSKDAAMEDTYRKPTPPRKKHKRI